MDREIAFENKRIYRSPGGDIMRQALPMRDAVVLFSETRPVKSLRRKYSNCGHDCGYNFTFETSNRFQI